MTKPTFYEYVRYVTLESLVTEEDVMVPLLTPEQEVIIEGLREALEEVLETLTRRENMTIKMRFGIDYPHNMTLDEVGNLYGISRERVRQIIEKSLRKLRHPNRSFYLHPFLP